LFGDVAEFNPSNEGKAHRETAMTTRPERVPAEEIRQRMLDAGRELALEAGAALTIEHLRLEEVIQRARVPRSSAYRLWPYKEDYIEDLLCYLAGAGSWFSDRTVMTPETSTVVSRVIEDNRSLLASTEGRRAVLREVIRITTERNYRALSESAPWRLHMALVATLGATGGGGASGTSAGRNGGPDDGGEPDDSGPGGARHRVAIALEEAQSRSRAVMVSLFGVLADEVGIRLRDPAWTVEHLQLAGGLFVQSLALRNVQVQTARGEGGQAGGDMVRHVHALLNAPVPGPGLHGTTADWTLVSLGYLSMVEAFVELDPDFIPPQGSGPAG
jgi:AcrR family transcriptional regulator